MSPGRWCRRRRTRPPRVKGRAEFACSPEYTMVVATRISGASMRIASCAAALALMTAAAPVSAQQPIAFEVASIKLAAPLDPQKIMSGQMRIGMHVDPQRVEINSLSLADLINIAFKTKAYQVVGPSWLSQGGMNADRFDIRATLPPGATTEQVPEMLQALLVERFKLQFHREEKPQDVFALVVGK